MKIKLSAGKIIALTLASVVFVLSGSVFYILYTDKKEMEKNFERWIGPATEYLESKYGETFTFNQELYWGEQGYLFRVRPENGQHPYFNVDCTPILPDDGNTFIPEDGTLVDGSIWYGRTYWGGAIFHDEYLWANATWEQREILIDIIGLYSGNFECYVNLVESKEMIDILATFYINNGRHLNWREGEYTGAIKSASIHLCDCFDVRNCEMIMESILSEILALNFTISEVSFDVSVMIDGKAVAKSHTYSYENGTYQLCN